MVHKTLHKEGIMEQFFTDEDLFGLLDELDREEDQIIEIEGDLAEIEASNRRYEEIIRKHKMD